VTVPARPADDAIVDPLWGQWVHDSLTAQVPGIIIGRATAQSIPSGTPSVITLEVATIQRQVGGTWIAANGTTLTVPPNNTGVYLVVGNIIYNANTGGTTRTAEIAKGPTGLVVPFVIGSSVPPGGATTQYITTAAIVVLNAGDTLQLKTYQDSGAAITTYQANLAVMLLNRPATPAVATWG
jgi:hypothetical protein